VRRAAGLAALALVALLATGCAMTSAGSPATSSPPASPADTLSGDLTVYAAASLKTAFDELASAFEAQHPHVRVLPVVYDGSSTLATQLVEGAPADVYASADEANMATVTDAGLAGDPKLFATNTLVIVTPDGNPAGVAGLADLADEAVSVVVCAPEVPCGAASRTLLSNAGVTVKPASSEQNVTAVLSKVAAGEADAGLVYATDVRGRSDVEAIVPEGADRVVNRYPIVAMKDAANPAVAAAFTAFVVGPRGQAALRELGFGAP
jgi:molybdate transport system substrate-binding protein